MAQFLVVARDKHGNKLEEMEVVASGKNDAEIQYNSKSVIIHFESITTLQIYKLEAVFSYEKSTVSN